MNSPTVLHLPCASPPWVIGGRETFSFTLAKELQKLGWNNVIAYHQNPSVGEPLGHQEHEGIPIRVLPPLVFNRRNTYSCRVDDVHGYGDLLAEIRPEMVHLHDFSVAVNLNHIEAARARGAKTVMSFHSPGQSCLQRELLYNGRSVCDGEILLDRCTACRLGTQGIPSWIRWPLAKLSLPSIQGDSRIARALTARTMTELFSQAWLRLIEQIDNIHVYARWVREMMLRNRAHEKKVIFFGTGLPLTLDAIPSRKLRSSPLPIKLVMVGRCEPIKGQAVLIDAIKLLPTQSPIEVTFLGPYWDTTDYGRLCLQKIAGDQRFHPPRKVPHKEMPGELIRFDVLVVPSLWLETGPLVVLEGFACGLPVLGSRLGGIAELVQDNLNGLLFKPGDAQDLRLAIQKLLDQPEMIENLRNNIGPVRTMGDVAKDTVRMYQELLTANPT